MRYEFQNQYGIFDFTPEDEVYARLTEIIISKRFKELPSIFEICMCTIYDITNENNNSSENTTDVFSTLVKSATILYSYFHQSNQQ